MWKVNKVRKVVGGLVVGCILSTLLTPARVEGKTPYKTYTEGGYTGITETQAAYTPVETIKKVGDLSFKNASDLKITKDGEMYIADTDNKRVIVSTLEGELLRVYGEDILKSPTGIFITENKDLYVADKNSEKVVVFNYDGEIIKEYTRPNHPLYGEGMLFKPQKIAVDSKGIMYIVCEGNTNGVVQISPTDGGTFLGYFGTNSTEISLFNIFRRMILTDEQLAKLPRNVPKTPYNLTIDDKGLIYTVTQGDSLTLRKLNVAGNNLLEPSYSNGLPSAVAVGNYENIYVIDEEGYIFEYNKDGSMLFVFGGKDAGRQRIGLFQKGVAIAVDANNHLYVLDQAKNEVQVFETTEFTNLVHQALQLYQNGKYTESKEPLTQIIQMNSVFDYANLAMGQALLQEEDYQGALKFFRMAKERDGYSDSFWEIRNVWLRNNVVTVIGSITGLFFMAKLLKEVQKKKGFFTPLLTFMSRIGKLPLISRLNYMFYFIKHPIEGSYGVKRLSKASYLSANILFFIFILMNLLNIYGTGFILKRVFDGRYFIMGDVATILGVFILCTVCSYLVCTINDGEGTLKQLYSSYVYALSPYIIMKPFIVALSNVVTLNEQFLVQFSNFIMYGWIVILIFMAIKEINNYTVMETIKIILLTIFCALITVLLLFILYVLIMQVTDFVQAIYGEVVYRFENS